MENVNVYVQDSSLPGISAVGQLLDLSTGGLSFRPDRAFRVEDEAGLKMETAIFERGKHFPVIRIDGMPKLDGPIRLNGTVTHVEEKQSILVAFVFGMLDPDEEKNLAQALEIRESMGNQGGAGGPGPSSSPTGGQATADSDNLDDSEAGSAETNAEPDEAALDKTLAQLGNELRPLPPTILRLARRTCSILLVKPSGENCDEIIKSLKIAGFVRVSQCNDLDSHAVHTTQNASAMLVGIEIGGKPEDAVNSFRNIHERLQNRKVPKPIVISDQPEPSLLQTAEDLSLPIGFTSDLSWAEVLDRAIGLLGG